MGVDVPALTPVEESLYPTLAARALDSRSARPFLGDRMSDQIASMIGYDAERFPIARSKIFDITIRTKRMDELVGSFVRRHPDAVVVELGAGLDPRITRVPIPDTVDWLDVDLPGVIGIRRHVMPERPNAHSLATDLTDPEWIGGLPDDRPAIIVADGLIAFLTEAEFGTLLRQLTARFPLGEVVFDTYTKFTMWAIHRYRGTNSIAPVARHPGFDDPHDPEHWDPDLELVEELHTARAPEVERLPLGLRTLNHLTGRSTRLSRQSTTVLRYRF